MKFALDGIFSFSNVPIRIATYCGLLLMALGILGMLWILGLHFFTKVLVPGVSMIIVTIVIISGFQIIVLGIIGEYVGRIFEEAKRRPLYVVNETINLKHE